VLHFLIPVSFNPGSNFDLGLINLQAPEVRCTIDLTCGAASDAMTGTPSFTGTPTIDTHYLFYEIPDPNKVQLPRPILCRTLQESLAIAATGDNIYQVPRGGTLLSMHQLIRANGARSDALDLMQIKFNKTATPYARTRNDLRFWQRFNNSVEYPVGAYLWDFAHSQESPQAGDARDWVDTEKLTTLEFIATITSGTTLGSGNNFYVNTRRILQAFQS